MIKKGFSQSAMAMNLKVHRSTVKKEIERNSSFWGYDPTIAHIRSQKRRYKGEIARGELRKFRNLITFRKRKWKHKGRYKDRRDYRFAPFLKPEYNAFRYYDLLKKNPFRRKKRKHYKLFYRLRKRRYGMPYYESYVVDKWDNRVNRRRRKRRGQIFKDLRKNRRRGLSFYFDDRYRTFVKRGKKKGLKFFGAILPFTHEQQLSTTDNTIGDSFPASYFILKEHGGGVF